MKVIIDMCLPPLWVQFFEEAEIESKHWTQIGDPKAPDSEIFSWAQQNNYIVFTHDLDFGAILAATNANSPSVVQIRTQDVTPGIQSQRLIEAMKMHENYLLKGALLTIDEVKAKVRILPIHS
jgi:predicted nuclease of predicted toxin-antitoxin system